MMVGFTVEMYMNIFKHSFAGNCVSLHFLIFAFPVCCQMLPGSFIKQTAIF